MFKRLYIIILIFFISYLGCNIKYPPDNEAVLPEISEIIIPHTVYLDSDVRYPVDVKVTDLQGNQNISAVKFILTEDKMNQIVYSDTMHDDGLNGDIIINDNTYHTNIPHDFTDKAGYYIVNISISDFLGDTLFFACCDTIFAVKGVINTPPSISNPVIPDTLNMETIKDVIFSVKADDPDGQADIDSVFIWIYPPFKASPCYTKKLTDNGLSGDTAPGDSIYTFRADMSSILGSAGVNTVRFQAVDKGGAESAPLVEYFYIDVSNLPPLIGNLTAPDTLSRHNTQSSLLSVEVEDPQGPGDIDIVFFNSFLPDGTAGSGNPHLMFDDGSNGDKIVNDGIFSITIYMSSSVNLGNYRFEFIARDNSQAMSDTLQHIITVVD